MAREGIEAKFNIKVFWFEYRQLHHMFGELEAHGGLDFTKPPLEMLVAGAPMPDSGLLSTIYRSLMNLKPLPEFAYQRAWKRELQSNLGEQQWTETRSSSLFYSRSVNVLMTTKKILLRWHLTPDRIRKMSLNFQSKCWKGCGLRGTHLHCYWACPRLQTLWDFVFRQISLIIGQNLTNVPELVVLNLWGGKKLDGLKKVLVEQLLCAACMLITMMWKTPRIPTSRDWYLKVWDLYLQDKISMSLLRAENISLPTEMIDKFTTSIHITEDRHQPIRQP